MHAFKNNCKRLTLLWLIFVFVTGGLACSAGDSESSILFIGTRPGPDMPRLGPHFAYFYRIDTTQGLLEKVLSIDKSGYVKSVKRYAGKDGLILIGTRGGEMFDSLYIINPESTDKPTAVGLKEFGEISDFRLIETSDPAVYLRLLVFDRVGFQFRQQQIGIDPDKSSAVTVEATVDDNYLRLAGVRSPYYGPGNDVLPVTFGDSGRLVSRKGTQTFNTAPIPPDLAQLESTKGHVMIANEPQYICVMSIPDWNSQSHRELLIYNKAAASWNSMLLEGELTTPRLINNWLVVAIAGENPNTDLEGGLGIPPILREDAVLIDPINLTQFTVHLGERCEVLWIESDTIYYRTGIELYQARIDQNKLVDRRLLVKHPHVGTIHWAFRGSLRSK